MKYVVDGADRQAKRHLVRKAAIVCTTLCLQQLCVQPTWTCATYLNQLFLPPSVWPQIWIRWRPKTRAVIHPRRANVACHCDMRLLDKFRWSLLRNGFRGHSKLFQKWLPFDKQDMMRTTTQVTKRLDLVRRTVGYKEVVYYEAV